MQVLVAGGPASFVKFKFALQLSQYGLSLGAHWPADKRPGVRIPNKCGGVIILKDHISHNLSDVVSALAKAQDLPCLKIPRKMSIAAPALESSDLVAKAQMKSVSQIPSSTNGGLIGMHHEQSQLRQRHEAQVRKLAETLLEDRPEHSDAEIYDEVCVLWEGDRRPSETLALRCIGEVRASMQASWQGGKARMAEDEYNKFNELRRAWVERILQEHHTRKRPFPNLSWFRKESKFVFGVRVADKIVKAEMAKYQQQQSVPAAPPPRVNSTSRTALSKSEAYDVAARGVRAMPLEVRMTIWRFAQRGRTRVPDPLRNLLGAYPNSGILFVAVLLHCAPEGEHINPQAVARAYKQYSGKNLNTSSCKQIAADLGMSDHIRNLEVQPFRRPKAKAKAKSESMPPLPPPPSPTALPPQVMEEMAALRRELAALKAAPLSRPAPPPPPAPQPAPSYAPVPPLYSPAPVQQQTVEQLLDQGFSVTLVGPRGRTN